MITLGALEEINKNLMEETIKMNCPKAFDLTQLDSVKEAIERKEAKVKAWQANFRNQNMILLSH